MLELEKKAKWNAWDAKKGLSKEEAQEKYIAYAEQLIAKYV